VLARTEWSLSGDTSLWNWPSPYGISASDGIPRISIWVLLVLLDQRILVLPKFSVIALCVYSAVILDVPITRFHTYHEIDDNKLKEKRENSERLKSLLKGLKET
jgi:hypothetical protein